MSRPGTLVCVVLESGKVGEACGEKEDGDIKSQTREHLF